MKVVIVSPHPIVPANSGDRIRTFQLMHALLDLKVDVTVLCYAWNGEKKCEDPRIQFVQGRPPEGWSRAVWRLRLLTMRRTNPYGICQLTYPKLAMGRALERIAPDIVDFQHSWTWFPTRFRNVVTFIDVLSANCPRGPLGRKGHQGILAMERGAAEMADTAVTLSELDASRVIRLTDRPGSVIPVALGYDPGGRNPPRIQRQHMTIAALVGSFDYPPNRDGAKRLLEIWPRVKAVTGLQTLCLIGRQAARFFDPQPDVEVISDPEDVKVPLERVDVLLIPLAEGRGVRVKAIEAFALRIPVVSTMVGIEGLGVESGTHAQVVDQIEQMPEAIVQVTDKAVRERMATEAHKLWEHSFTPQRMASRMESIYLSLITSTEPNLPGSSRLGP